MNATNVDRLGELRLRIILAIEKLMVIERHRVRL